MENETAIDGTTAAEQLRDVTEVRNRFEQYAVADGNGAVAENAIEAIAQLEQDTVTIAGNGTGTLGYRGVDPGAFAREMEQTMRVMAEYPTTAALPALEQPRFFDGGAMRPERIENYYERPRDHTLGWTGQLDDPQPRTATGWMVAEANRRDDTALPETSRHPSVDMDMAGSCLTQATLDDIHGRLAALAMQHPGEAVDIHIRRVNNTYRPRLIADTGCIYELLVQLMDERGIMA